MDLSPEEIPATKPKRNAHAWGRRRA